MRTCSITNNLGGQQTPHIRRIFEYDISDNAKQLQRDQTPYTNDTTAMMESRHSSDYETSA